MVGGCWSDSSFHMLNIANILLPFVSTLDGRLDRNWVPMCVPLQRGLSTSSPDFPSRCNKETTAWDILAACCAHSLNRPVKKHSEKSTPKKRQRELSHRLHARVEIEVSLETDLIPLSAKHHARVADEDAFAT